MKRAQRRDLEVTMVRRELRSSGVFQFSDDKSMQSIIGEDLDYDLPNMNLTIDKAYQQYKSAIKSTSVYKGVIALHNPSRT